MRLLHTADWQIGMKATSAGDRAADVRAQRIATVRDIVRVANERAVDVLIAAGDQFEACAPSVEEIGAVANALAAARMPVLVLPGNHDPAVPESPYATHVWRALCGAHITTVLEPHVLRLPGADVLAAPCRAKYGTADPTEAFAALPSPADTLRIGVAHGTLQLGNIPRADAGDQRGGFPIARDAASRAGLAYLALGHWHSHLAVADGASTIAYAGTPEQTRYDDADCGTVSVVTVDGPRAAAVVERVAVGRYRWSAPTFELGDDASVERAIAELRAWPDASTALVRPTFRGLVTPHGAALLAAADADLRARYFFYDPQHAFAPRPDSAQAWLDRFDAGLARALAERLLARANEPALAADAMTALTKLLEMSR